MTLPDTQERKCVCGHGEMPVCKQPYKPGEYEAEDGEFCTNLIGDYPCGHDRACHHPLRNQEQPND